MNKLISIKNLHAEIEGQKILKGLNLEINLGEVHAIMGPNGSGKSTLSKVLSGHPDYEVTAGEVIFNGKNMLDLDIEERANEGLFLAFQYPFEIPGVTNQYFLKTAINAKRKYQGEKALNSAEFLRTIKAKMKNLDMDIKFRGRDLNVGFSGGEKKKNEILQLNMLDPKFAVLDEIDSGLDIDALRIVAKGVNSMRDSEHSFLMITHYQRLLDYIEPDFVHIMKDGQIVKTGDKNLALELEESGYGEF